MKLTKSIKLFFPWVFAVMLGGGLLVSFDEWRHWLFFALAVGCVFGGIQAGYIQGMKDGSEAK